MMEETEDSKNNTACRVALTRFKCGITMKLWNGSTRNVDRFWRRRMHRKRQCCSTDPGRMLIEDGIVPPPTLREVKDAIQYFKNRQSTKWGWYCSLAHQGGHRRIDRTQLRKTMDEGGFSGKLTRLINASMNDVQNCVWVSAELSSRRGLRQGDGLSCLLFNIALESIMRRTERNPVNVCALRTTWTLASEHLEWR